MNNPRLKTHALQSAWNVLKTTLLPPAAAAPDLVADAWFPPSRRRCSGRESCSTTPTA